MAKGKEIVKIQLQPLNKSNEAFVYGRNHKNQSIQDVPSSVVKHLRSLPLPKSFYWGEYNYKMNQWVIHDGAPWQDW